ncbi:MAG: hypothetical protein ACYC7D_01150 [Nitrososphaerales archaeon]
MRRPVVFSGVVIIILYLILVYFFTQTTCTALASQLQTLLSCSISNFVSVFGVIVLILGFIVIGIGMRLGSNEQTGGSKYADK